MINEKFQAGLSGDENPNKSAKYLIQSSSENHDTFWRENPWKQKEVISKRDKNGVEELCDHVVADYLKRNGLSEVLSEFLTCRNIRCQFHQTFLLMGVPKSWAVLKIRSTFYRIQNDLAF